VDADDGGVSGGGLHRAEKRAAVARARRRRDPHRQDHLDQFATGLVGVRSPPGAGEPV
jgi:hypothetical protein